VPAAIIRYARRIWSVFRTYGLAGIVRRGTNKLRSVLGMESKSYRAFVAAKAQADADFDRSANADTGGVQHLPGLTIASPNAVHGSSHIAVSPQEFASSLTVAEQDFPPPDQTSFVDLGSGKGRALLMAADRGYARVIGVEFAGELDAIARRNVAGRADRDRFTLIHGDAADFDLPAGPVLLFLYHPFDRPVMATVAEKAMRSWLADPRPIRVVYQNPIFADAWLEAGWRPVATPPDGVVYAPA
jgi:SAM-dependent methyltransferase